jgi:hypothetical protein
MSVATRTVAIPARRSVMIQLVHVISAVIGDLPPKRIAWLGDRDRRPG